MPFGFPLFSWGVSFAPDTDIQDLSGKVILITGGNSGLGYETALKLAAHKPQHIYISARNESKALASIQLIKASVPDAQISFLQCDLTSLPSVQESAREFVSKEKRLDVLILNAGIMATPPGTTEQGYEIQFGTNHVGHALLTKLLLPTMLRTAEEPGADVRVVSLSSWGHRFAPLFSGIVFSDLKSDMASYLTLIRYGQSKLANILFAKELARQFPQITSVALHPGVVNTELYKSASTWGFGVGWMIDLARTTVCTSAQDGAKHQLWAGVGKGVVSGEYYMPIGITGQESKLADDAGLAMKLWEWTEKELEGYNL